MIELHLWPTPNGIKITIMLEECGLPYEVKYVNIGKGDQFEPKFLEISPNNRMPGIIDTGGPDGKAISVFESDAILQYLGRKTGKFYPREERARVNVDEWLAKRTISGIMRLKKSIMPMIGTPMRSIGPMVS